jgi:hypothetical protein
MMQGAALAIAEDRREGEDLPFSRGEQLLAGKLRRGVEVERLLRAVGGDQLRCKAMQVGFVAGRELQRGGFDLYETLRLEPAPDGGLDTAARQEKRPLVCVPVWAPPRAFL